MRHFVQREKKLCLSNANVDGVQQIALKVWMNIHPLSAGLMSFPFANKMAGEKKSWKFDATKLHWNRISYDGHGANWRCIHQQINCISIVITLCVRREFVVADLCLNEIHLNFVSINTKQNEKKKRRKSKQMGCTLYFRVPLKLIAFYFGASD